MSLALVPEPGDLTPDEAQVLTAKIKAHVTQAWLLITEAHDRRAYKALGYDTFAAYVEAEFDMKRAHAYRLINQGRVIAELAHAAGVSTLVDTDDVSPMGDTGTMVPSVTGHAEPYYRRTDLATWAEVQAGLAERQRNVDHAREKLKRYRDGMAALAPLMASDPDLTVADAMRRRLGKAA